jgi:hypothetical protein
LRAAGARIGAGIAEQRKGVGQAQRIVSADSVKLKGILPADRQRSPLLVAEAAIELAVERLAATAAVGV